MSGLGTRWLTVCSVVALGLVSGTPAAEPASVKKPNVVFILADDKD